MLRIKRPWGVSKIRPNIDRVPTHTHYIKHIRERNNICISISDNLFIFTYLSHKRKKILSTMSHGSESDTDDAPRRITTRQTARRSRPFNRRQYETREAFRSITRDRVAEVIRLAIQVLEGMIMHCARTQPGLELVEGLLIIRIFLLDLGQELGV